MSGARFVRPVRAVKNLWQMLGRNADAMLACLVVNDTLKVALIKLRIPAAVAKAPVDLTPESAERAAKA